eukprot:scaffold7795_cov403-Prasinococcus_capsulatus_cf.AAC.2
MIASPTYSVLQGIALRTAPYKLLGLSARLMSPELQEGQETRRIRAERQGQRKVVVQLSTELPNRGRQVGHLAKLY